MSTTVPLPLTDLRQRIEDILAGPPAPWAALPTGVAGLDGVLPAGGIPRGRLTELVGEDGCGRTSVARALVQQTMSEGHRVAYVDAERTLAPRDWVAVSESGGSLWVVRPPRREQGAWCADILLRSGAFALVVLDGAPQLGRGPAVRLTGLARERGTALVALGWPGGASQVGGALRLRVRAGQSRDSDQRRTGERTGDKGERRAVVQVERGGANHSVEVNCAIGVARRLCTHPEVPDRRGVARAGSARHDRAGDSGRARGPAPDLE